MYNNTENEDSKVAGKSLVRVCIHLTYQAMTILILISLAAYLAGYPDLAKFAFNLASHIATGIMCIFKVVFSIPDTIAQWIS